MKSLKVGLCGTGNVGSAVLDALTKNPEITQKQGGVQLEVILVGARKGKSAVRNKELKVVTDLRQAASSDDIDVFVELIGGCELAKELVEIALRNGKDVVTANKALIATHGDELFKLAKENKVQIGFEASVAGGTPVIKALREGLVASRVQWFAGILNGTTNFILSEMSENNTNFDVALKEAQDLGLAETDPTMDIDGTDAAQKASILAALAFQVPFEFDSVSYGGIDQVDLEDLNYAKELGYSIKHIAYGNLNEGKVNVSAYPTLVSKELLLSQVGQQMNALDICCEEIGSTVYYGPGAGPKPTASAVIADLVDLANGGWPAQESGSQVNKISKKIIKPFPRYFRLEVKNEAGAIAKISSIFAEENISIEALIQHEAKKLKESLQDTVPVVIISGSVDEEVTSRLISSLESMDEINSQVKQFRIHNAL
ncbi:MAG: homoserine dehydrogenase [Gammaproteobacteria bacterium]|jgi:homoserine dehydrogenase|nr:homoserine dehydrogenase [Gammaproteobacteria bacterium]|tara:strand:- start:3302 stop:4588 length:1287 start_codon:yes stop_codon:yes gene_type:complete